MACTHAPMLRSVLFLSRCLHAPLTGPPARLTYVPPITAPAPVANAACAISTRRRRSGPRGSNLGQPATCALWRPPNISAYAPRQPGGCPGTQQAALEQPRARRQTIKLWPGRRLYVAQVVCELELPAHVGSLPPRLLLDGFLLRPSDTATLVRDGDLLQLQLCAPPIRPAPQVRTRVAGDEVGRRCTSGRCRNCRCARAWLGMKWGGAARRAGAAIAVGRRCPSGRHHRCAHAWLGMKWGGAARRAGAAIAGAHARGWG
eukprot:364731-Chlamydomonas_euryale.AAC.21